MPRIARPCYDKPHRCPGLRGPGTRYNKPGKNWCPGGFVYGGQYERLRNWRVHRCEACGTYVLPYVVRWLDWRWWRWVARDLARKWEDIW